MSAPSNAESILSHAGKQEKEYDWAGAAGSYGKVLDIVPKQELGSLCKIQEKIGYCFYRAASQAETCEEFKNRMQLAADHYSVGAELFGAIEKTETHAESNNCKAMATYAQSRLASDSSAKKERLNESWKFAKEALKFNGKTRDQMNVGKTCNNLMILLTDRLNVEWDAELRNKIIEEALGCGEKAIEIFQKTQDTRQLAQAYISAAYFYRNAAFAKGLKAERREECRAKALTYPQKAMDLSNESADSYTIGQSNLCLADARLDILGTGGLEEGQYYEKALQCGTLMKDKLIIADALFGLLYVTNNNTKALENPDKAREEYAKLDKYWENAVHNYSIVAHNSGVAMACFQMITTMRDRSGLETNYENKRQFLEKSIEVGYKGLEHAHLSGSLAPTFHVTLSLGKAILQLARMENDIDRKKNLLKESSRHIEQSNGILEQASAVSLVEPRGVNLSFNIWTLAANQVELAKVEENVGAKIKILVDSISNAKAAYDFWLEWIRSPWANVESPFWSIVGAYEIETGKTLDQLCELTDDRTFLEKSVEAFNRSVDAYEKANLPTRLAEAYWQIAKAYDRLAKYPESARNFELASHNYKHAATKIPQLKEFYADYATYMRAWHEIEKAIHEHKSEEYLKAKEHYEKVAELHNSTERWKHISSNYLAWARLDEAENLSREEKAEEAKTIFHQAAKLFAEAKYSIQAKIETVETKDERELLVNLAKAADVRREYCFGRIALEEAKILDRQGDHAASAGKYGSAAEEFRKIMGAMKNELDREELEPIVYLCKAWQMMARAEAEASPHLYLEASRLFEEAKEKSSTERAKLLALGHSRFCQALEAGTRFEDTRDTEIYSTAKKHIEAAENYYLKAAFTNASEYAKATYLLFDAYMFIHQAETVTDPANKATHYQMAERLLQSSASSYMKAKQAGKSETVRRLLESVKEKRQLAMSLTELLYAPAITSTTTSFSTPTPTQEQPVGLERFEQADVQANLILGTKEAKVGDDVDFEIELINAGKASASLIRVEEIVPESFEIRKVPEIYRIEGSCLNMKGKRLDPLKTEEIRLVLRSFEKGTFEIAPRIVCIDETGNQVSRGSDPATITISEVVLPGRISTGFVDLDNLLYGGIPENYSVVLTAPSCDERDLLIRKFVETGLREGQTTFYVTIEVSGVRNLAEQYQSNFYIFICNPRAEAMIESSPNVFKLKGVENLTDIDITLTSAFRKLEPASGTSRRRACIEIVSDVLLQHHAVTTRRWLAGLIPDLRSRGFITLAVMNPYMHSSEEVHSILSLFEGEISIYEKETRKGSEKFLKVKKMYNHRYSENELPLRKDRLEK